MKTKKTSRKASTRLVTRFVCLALVLSALTGAGYAASAQNVSATLSPNTKIVVDGVSRTFYNTAGKEVHPIAYNGTTYLPVRAIGELMGKNTNWDEATLTVTLSGVRGAPSVTGTPEALAAQKTITAQLRPDFTIVVDGTTRSFSDANGGRVYPLLYSGSTYLPVRATGEMMGKSVSWSAATNTVTLSAPSGSTIVTDADSFTTGQTTQQPPASGSAAYIGEAKAKEIALSRAGLAANAITAYRCELDRDNGVMKYEIEFRSGGYEYEVDVNATTGVVVKYDRDLDD